MHQTLEVAMMLGDFPDDARADVGRLDRWHHEHGLEAFGHVSIHQRHLELVLEIADGAEPANVERGAHFFGKIDEQAFERSDFDAFLVRSRESYELDTLFNRKQRFFCRVDCDGDDEMIDELAAPPDQILMAPRDRVEAPSIDGRGYHVIPRCGRR